MRIEIDEKKECCGCSACFNNCPRNCIDMKPDEEGFLYPVIDKSQCVDCGLCTQVCPIKHAEKCREQQPQAYACMNLDVNERMKSSSGGVFILFAKKILAQNGIVFGATFNDEAEVQHIGVEREDDLEKILGSKYVQSNIDRTYQNVKKNLVKGKKVLFCGTPCQCAGLKEYLRIEYENLYLVDFICHGVPSPSVWKKYLSALETKIGKQRNRAVMPSFRDKTDGWIHFSLRIPFSSTTEYRKRFGKDLYMRTFLKNISLRPSCYQCCFKPSTSISDITLGDFWGIQKSYPNMFDDKGTSIVFVNSSKGNSMFREIIEETTSMRVDYEVAVCHNAAVYSSVKEPEMRKVFFDNFENKDIIELMRNCTKENLLKRCIKAMWNLLK